MWLVLCEPGDASAQWAYKGLRDRDLNPIRMVTTRELCFGVRWEHRLGTDGSSVNIKLADGTQIRDREIRGVLNRIRRPSPENLVLIQPSDRDYVEEELFSFYLSWLHAIDGPILNRPTPHGLSGRWRDHSEWICLAARAGLPVPHFQQSSHGFCEADNFSTGLIRQRAPLHTVLVVDGHVVGEPIHPKITEGCRRLSLQTDTTILGIHFSLEPSGKKIFAGATTHPDLRSGGESFLAHLAQALKPNTVSRS